MRSPLAVIALAALAAGCETDSNHAATLCNAFCECGSIIPAQHDRCVAECVADVPDDLPEACTECVLTESCGRLQAGACDAECQTDDEETP